MADCCGNGRILIYPCGGGANTGEISDRVARELQKRGFGKMSCLAALGAHLNGFIVSAEDADQNVVIDGCPIACASNIFRHLDIPAKSYLLTDMNVVKGQTPVDKRVIDELVSLISQDLPKNEDSGSCCCH